MAKLNQSWIVHPHGPVIELAPGLLTVVGQIPMPFGNFPRRMTVVGLAKERTVIFSPVPLGQVAMAQVEALGDPAFLIVPNGGHRLDIAPFKARYPNAKVVAAAGACAKVEEAVEVDTSTPSLGSAADLIEVAGMGGTELALLFRHEGGASLIVNDIIGHVAHPHGFGAAIMARLTGFGPAARVPRLVRRFYLKDAQALAAQFEQWAEIKGLLRIIPAHGDVIDRPAALLRRLATGLRG